MKKYNDYMDRVRISGEAHDRILEALKREESSGTAAGPEIVPSAGTDSLPWYRRKLVHRLVGVTAALFVLAVGISAVIRSDSAKIRPEAGGFTPTSVMTANTAAGAVPTGTAAYAQTAEAYTNEGQAPADTPSAASESPDSAATRAGASPSAQTSAAFTPTAVGNRPDASAAPALVDCRDGRTFRAALSPEDSAFLKKILTGESPEADKSASAGPECPADGLWFFLDGRYYSLDPLLTDAEWQEPLARLLERCGVPGLK